MYMDNQLQQLDDAFLVSDYIKGNERALEVLVLRHKIEDLQLHLFQGFRPRHGRRYLPRDFY